MLDRIIDIFDLIELTRITITKEKPPMAEEKKATPSALSAPKGPVKLPKEIAQYTTHMPSVLQLKDLKDNFKFDEIDERHNLMILVSGPPKKGKTHFACTMSEIMPTYLLDGEHKGGIVAQKFAHTKRLRYKKVNSFLELIAAVRYITTTPGLPKGCIIIDSGSDLQIWAEEQYLLENGKDAVGLPYNWADVFSKCNSVIKDIKAAGFDLILTTRMKEEYKKNASTGRIVPRIWDNALYLSDLAIEWQGEGKAMVRLNALRKQDEPVPVEVATIGELLKLMAEQKAVAPATPAMKAA